MPRFDRSAIGAPSQVGPYGSEECDAVLRRQREIGMPNRLARSTWAGAIPFRGPASEATTGRAKPSRPAHACVEANRIGGRQSGCKREKRMGNGSSAARHDQYASNVVPTVDSLSSASTNTAAASIRLMRFRRDIR